LSFPNRNHITDLGISREAIPTPVRAFNFRSKHIEVEAQVRDYRKAGGIWDYRKRIQKNRHFGTEGRLLSAF
jgi:hypothetical protein